MPRPLKKGLDYFPFDVDFFEDLRIRKLKKYCGNQSIPVLVAILCYIFREEGYFVGVDSDFVFLIAEQFGISEGSVEDIIQKMVQVEYFDSHQFHTNNILTSKRIQEIYFSAVSERKEVEVHAIFLSNGVNPPINSINPPINSINPPDNEQRKEKKSKEKKSKENNKGNSADEVLSHIAELAVSERLKESLISFTDMRKSIKKPLTINALDLIIKRLNKIAVNEDEKIEVLENSIMNSWQGIFPLKKEGKDDGFRSNSGNGRSSNKGYSSGGRAGGNRFSGNNGGNQEEEDYSYLYSNL